MGAVYVSARSQLRRRWSATVALVLLVGLAGGVVIGAVAGASRTDSSMRRFVAFSKPEDVFVVVNGPRTGFLPGGGIAGAPQGVTPAQVQAYFAAVEADRTRLVHLPQVADIGRAPYMFMSPDRTGREIGSINPFATADAHMFRTLDRPLVLQGRLARLDRADEAVVDDVAARLRHLRVGSRITLYSYTVAQSTAAALSGFGALPTPAGPAYTFRIVGIVRDPTEVEVPPTSVVGDAVYQGAGGLVMTPAFLRNFAADQREPVEAVPGIEGFRIRLRHGLADLPAFQRELPALDVQLADVHAGSDIQQAADKAQRAIHFEALALLLFGGLAGVAALVIVGQALSRQVIADAANDRTLAALGMRRVHRVLVALAGATVIAAAGALIAVAVAIALSPLTPIGLARRAEIHPGLSVNGGVLVAGFFGVVVATWLRALLPAVRATRGLAEATPARPAGRPAPAANALASLRLRPAAAAGLSMSVAPGRGAAFRTALAGVVVAVAGVVAAVTVGVSLHRLVDSPRQQGWNWDVVIGNPNTQPYQGDPAADPLHRQLVDRLAGNPFVAAFSGFGAIDGVTVDGKPVNVAGVEPDKGAVGPSVVDGRAPAADDEIAVGRDTLRQLRKHVGQTVSLGSGDRARNMRIVGTILMPTAADMAPKLASGGAVTMGALRSVAPDTPVLQFFVRFRPGANHSAAVQSLLGQFGREVLSPYPGGEVGDLARIDYLPFVLAGLLVVLAVAALGLMLLTTVRRHRRDLAVLKTLGFGRRQVAATVAWQATALAVGAVVLGVPAGVAIGRWTWRLVAGSAGSVSPVVVPVLSVALVVPLTLAVANILAVGPGWAAGRVRPAEALRAE